WRVGAVSRGGRGMLWGPGRGEVRRLPALAVPDARVVDTKGAGDIFHGAYIYAFLANPFGLWEDHFRFARAASAHAIQYLGNEASLPTLAQINEAHARFDERREAPRLVVSRKRGDKHGGLRRERLARDRKISSGQRRPRRLRRTAKTRSSSSNTRFSPSSRWWSARTPARHRTATGLSRPRCRCATASSIAGSKPSARASPAAAS